jgi:hypothetical protein
MTITPMEARKKLIHLCKEAWFQKLKVNASDVADLHKFIDEVEKLKLPQTPALFKPPVAPAKEHPFLQPVDAGD